jgi:transposase
MGGKDAWQHLKSLFGARSRVRPEASMEPIIERCCGLDVHQATVVACVLVGRADQRAKKEVRSFGTFTRDLLALRDWLREQQCTHVAMESTGVYWKPVYAVLEGDFDLVVGNAHHIKNVPGRKTDVEDSEWIADLLRHGLIAKSFVPPQPIRELRDLMRYRHKLVESRTAERNRLLKLLETANIKVSSVATNVFGKSGMSMLEALARGESDAKAMAELAQGLLRKKIGALEGALDGRVGEHHRFLLRVQLDRLKAVEQDVRKIDDFVDAKLEPYRSSLRLLEEIPGVGTHTAVAIIAEAGDDMRVFHSERHFAAWAGVCPGNNESAGKKMEGRTRKGNKHLRKTLVEAALGAVRTRGSYFKAKYHSLKARRGIKRAAMAISHKIAIAVFRILRDGTAYTDLGETYLDSLATKRTTKHLVHRLERLGYRVVLEPATAAA